VAIVTATIALAIALVRWSDSDLRRTFRSSRVPLLPYYGAGRLPRPAWVDELFVPYRRLHHNWLWFCVAVTLGAAALLARDPRTWTRRGAARTSTLTVVVALLVGALTAVGPILRVLTAVPGDRTRPLGQLLASILPNPVIAAVVGVWVVAWLRQRRGSPGWRDRVAHLAGWSWIAHLGMTIGNNLLFG
jgi:hypothetical protein